MNRAKATFLYPFSVIFENLDLSSTVTLIRQKIVIPELMNDQIGRTIMFSSISLA